MCSEPKRDEMIVWRKVHNGKLNNFYPSPNVIRMVKARCMRRAEHVARTGKKKKKKIVSRERLQMILIKAH